MFSENCGEKTVLSLVQDIKKNDIQVDCYDDPGVKYMCYEVIVV